MKPALKMLGVSVLSVLLGSITGILVALALYGTFPRLYREAHDLPVGIDLGPAAGFEFFLLAIGLFVIVSNVTASLTGIAIWSFLQRVKRPQE